jgi:uncharacterized protein YkuJ
MRLFIFLLISNLVLASGIYHIERIKDDNGQEKGVRYYDTAGDLVKDVKYTEYDKEMKVIKGELYDFIDDKNSLIGTIEYFYNKDKLFLTIERGEEKEILKASWYFEKDEDIIEEVRDSKNNVISYYLHGENTLEDITKRIIEEKALDKLVVVEEKLIKTFRPLDSLKDILESNKNLVIAQTLKTIDMEYADRMELLGPQLVVDAIKSYTHVEGVIMPGISFDGRITIGGVKYNELKNLIKDEKLYLVTVSGEKIEKLLKNSAKLPKVHREFVHTAGITYEIDKRGNVKNIKIEGRALDPMRNYSLVIPQYVKDGKGIYYIFADENVYDIPYETSLITADYLKGIRIIDDSYRVEERRKKI